MFTQYCPNKFLLVWHVYTKDKHQFHVSLAISCDGGSCSQRGSTLWKGRQRRGIQRKRQAEGSPVLFSLSHLLLFAGDNNLECAVCLQTCIHPAQLPCGHVFCFLCVKGIANQSKKCAMCRQEIPRDFIEHPNLLQVPQSEGTEGFDGGYQWFYEGRNGRCWFFVIVAGLARGSVWCF